MHYIIGIGTVGIENKNISTKLRQMETEMSNIEIGKRIRKLREKHNYTREGLAEKLDISVKFLYEIETGKKGFSAETLCKLSKALSVSCDYIMYGEEEEQRNIDKIICILEMLKPGQVAQMQEILSILNRVLETCK